MRTAILVSTPVEKDLKEKIEADLSPQSDFFALQDALDAVLLTPIRASLAKRSSIFKFRESFKAAWEAFSQRDNYDLIITDVERVGALLALLFKVSRVKKHHIMICHGRLIRHMEGRLIKTLRLQDQIDRFVCYGPRIAESLPSRFGISSNRIITIQHAVDHRFWRPQVVNPEKLIASAGLTRRDYPTLIEAIKIPS